MSISADFRATEHAPWGLIGPRLVPSCTACPANASNGNDPLPADKVIANVHLMSILFCFIQMHDTRYQICDIASFPLFTFKETYRKSGRR